MNAPRVLDPSAAACALAEADRAAVDWPRWQALPARRISLGGPTAGPAVAGEGEGLERVAEEVPVALVLNGLSHAVMLATPGDLEDFALGFCLAEGILESPADLRGVEVQAGPQGIALALEISPRRFQALKLRRRQLAGRTGCGLCGVESLAEVHRELPRVPAGRPVAARAVAAALDALRAGQALFATTGAVHAAAWADAQGRVQCVREDVGRHNALDKLIGAEAARSTRFDQGFAVVTSRASVEMVQKLASVGGGLLVAVSAPTAYAVRTAEALGLTLVGFARGDRLTVYTHPDRLQAAA